MTDLRRETSEGIARAMAMLAEISERRSRIAAALGAVSRATEGVAPGEAAEAFALALWACLEVERGEGSFEAIFVTDQRRLYVKPTKPGESTELRAEHGGHFYGTEDLERLWPQYRVRSALGTEMPWAKELVAKLLAREKPRRGFVEVVAIGGGGGGEKSGGGT